ncbi:zn-finger domain-containing protein [Gigaspora margarita]|uniref:Zn-finger domain-containing protein n=1 Tax=Gigaspora margarita TaxID=4874 RepID=A0A8H4ERP5_GIGMA|nr:zn-finger domain-containing protein [Gigaspora margarita]
MQNNSSDDKNQEYDAFPNEAYTNFIVLVTKYKLNNAAENAIISFFNKHSNHSKSPLPKNIKQEKLFMNNMKSNLLYKKTKILDYDNTEYFLYHMPIMSCIQNILEISNISQTFALEYEELYKTTKNSKENIYKEQNNEKWWKTTQIKRDNLTNTNLNQKDIELRNHENMQYYYNSNEEQTVSIELVPNIF